MQLTLLANGQPRRGEFRTKLRAGARNYDCTVIPEEPVVPGGHAVHGGIVFDDPREALSHLPPGSTFELWEGSRRGYGMVLAVLAAA